MRSRSLTLLGAKDLTISTIADLNNGPCYTYPEYSIDGIIRKGFLEDSNGVCQC